MRIAKAVGQVHVGLVYTRRTKRFGYLRVRRCFAQHHPVISNLSTLAQIHGLTIRHKIGVCIYGMHTDIFGLYLLACTPRRGLGSSRKRIVTKPSIFIGVPTHTCANLIR